MGRIRVKGIFNWANWINRFQASNKVSVSISDSPPRSEKESSTAISIFPKAHYQNSQYQKINSLQLKMVKEIVQSLYHRFKMIPDICPNCGTAIYADSNIREAHEKACPGGNGPAANVGVQIRDNIGRNARNGIYARRQLAENANN